MSTATSFSEEQKQITLTVLSKDKSEFYEILQVEKTASDNEIKKAYRKLAIKLHPDKNSHPRASEAFKVINRAFEVLGDEQKRSIFDSTGRDPDDRSMGMNSSSASGFGQPGAGGQFPPGFQNMFFRGGPPGATGGAPEDIFDFLFNMGGNPGGFGGNHPFMNSGGATSFTFGPGGFRAYNPPRTRDQRNRQREAQRQHDEEQKYNDILRVLAPILLFFIIGVFERFLS
ncbi:similar to Saccharomyces cerevisiae YMR161W HLJ1 Co-chaperone for Hsp40p, anchored in the ER membrane [Maudiozyma barnettii]|uniref:Similar to Saccharomyces cerevisiae YMR161W HLJ1 Co-chaperone for Hsp40p, anchored in the ER membrane n=1 Tax=Maudiozyma barnettii TaxID=61262 RepID=A0A8H2VFA4_9SACH|nr:type I HSP40 co-chaperone HLJ1 [Kazachstania barnettii]CAB4254495.1 similar to Saccharomyces cerevisiae YMR161W HLJ1 Co-chaperone for Hsp40p, anchored in the ER membrane [Kazachstania barnettii]CAD1782501.1 similar to Saccharomyces cerevisiae YMR161W HLJ1 Co-chaperone for Hsp40p, anchored in the ER membrane [Kazachstania barnettii]